MATDPTRYRLDAQGVLWQQVRPGPRSPKTGWRCLGTAKLVTLHGTYTTFTVVGERGAKAPRDYRVPDGALIIEHGAPQVPTAPHEAPRPPIAGGADPVMVQVKVVDRVGALVLIEQPDGARFYLVVCPHCSADLSTVSMGRLMATARGVLPELWHPVRCPECKAALIPQPSSIVTARAGTLPKQ